MIQIDYELTKFYKVVFPKISLWGCFPESPLGGSNNGVTSPPDSLETIVGGGIPSTPHVKYWDPNTVATILRLRKIIKLHNQQYPTWRLITTTPPLLHLLDYAFDLGLGKFLLFTFMIEGQQKPSSNFTCTMSHTPIL